MSPFEYMRATQLDAATDALARNPAGRVVAGGTNILDLMKINVERPSLLVDINSLPLSDIQNFPNGIRIGALGRMSDVAADPLILSHCPVVSEALLASASPQIRNMASIGGNIMQRTRCTYFRDTSFACNKREPGSGCSAMEGENRMHAILGVSNACIATHPSDLAVALAALDASLLLYGQQGYRAVLMNAFYKLPGTTPHLENVLQPGELIAAVDIPNSVLAQRTHYVKVRDRASFEFALTSAAVGLEMSNGTISRACIALGGVGTKPWRASEAETALIGKRADNNVFAGAARIAVRGAVPHRDNAFKTELAQRTLIRSLNIASGKESST